MQQGWNVHYSESEVVLLWYGCCPFVCIRKGKGRGEVWTLAVATALFRYCFPDVLREASFTGLELQNDIAEMAKRSVAYNEKEDKVHIVQGDIREATSFLKLLPL